MGIQRISAPMFQVQRLTPGDDDVFELAGSRAPPKAPQRQRGVWSFLTWPFVIAPIVTAESFLNGHALPTGDQEDRAADPAKSQSNSTSDHDQTMAVAAKAPDDSLDDQTDTSRLVGAAPRVLHSEDPPHDVNAKPSVARDTVTTSSPAGSDGDGGGGGGGGGPSDSSASDTNASSDGDTAISHQIIIGASSSGGLYIDVPVGGEPGLAHTTSDVVSTLTGSVANILSPVGLDTSVNLKEILGFDLHVNASGAFVATDLSAALDLHLSHTVPNTVFTVVSPVADGLPLLNLGTSNALDSLFGGENNSVVGHVSDLTSIFGSDGATSALSGTLGSNSGASFGKLADAFLATSLDGGSDTRLPVVSTVSDLAHASIVGEATSITPGHSIDFSAPAVPEGDVLFRGNSYTDYHVALQTAGPSDASNNVAATPTSVTSTPDTASLAQVDPAAVNHAVPSVTAQHQDLSLIHISTTLDELSLRGHSH
jgi:hypothetical protein